MTRLTIFAGGTGGHVMPALAVAQALKEMGVDVNWIGTAQGLEARLVPQASIPFDLIDIKGVRKSGILRKVFMPFLLVKAMFQSLRILKRYKPEVVLGMGGFVSGPGGLTAASMKLPIVIHEQNSVPGLTNRWLAKLSKMVLTGFPLSNKLAAELKESVWVGNPVRQEIINIAEPKERLKDRKGALRVLVIGGSQGASIFNKELPKIFQARDLPALDVWHQSGQQGRNGIGEAYLRCGIGSQVNEFINDMSSAYEWCDVIICRSGAMTVSEICCAGVAAIFVPYPYAVSDHQAANAEYLVNQNAAYMVRQEEFLKGDWLDDLIDLATNRKKLLAMSEAARSLSKPNAAKEVAKICLEMAHA